MIGGLNAGLPKDVSFEMLERRPDIRKIHKHLLDIIFRHGGQFSACQALGAVRPRGRVVKPQHGFPEKCRGLNESPVRLSSGSRKFSLQGCGPSFLVLFVLSKVVLKLDLIEYRSTLYVRTLAVCLHSYDSKSGRGFSSKRSTRRVHSENSKIL